MAKKKASGTSARVIPVLEATPALRVRTLTARDWPIVETLFGARGACAGCWCMWWHVPHGGKLWKEMQGPKNKAAFKKRVLGGEVHGVLAFAGKTPVGWCAFGPRESFARLGNAPSLERDASADTWSVVCFFIPSGWRRKGVAKALLAAATERAFALGAAQVEGFPAVPASAEKPMPAAFAWTGVPALFVDAGYRKLRRPAGMRPVYVKERVKR
jgi:GNAT superfamily N-acetyltransferase